MNSLRRWLYRPKRSDPSLLAQFYFADEELNLVAAELDSFEGRKDPERCTALVNQLRSCQARVLNVISQMMDETVKDQRAPRDFRVKFPDDVIQENLAGQLWFGAECLAAGSSIMNREVESACMRPLARALTKNLDSLRSILREQCLRSVHEYTESIRESLIIFDKLFAEFELSYVTAMVPVKTAHEYDMIQDITVLFSETVQRALKTGLLTRDMIDEYDPALMFTIPRLAIVSGVLVFKDGPLNPDNDPWNISEMFRPFQTLLLKIRELLGILTDEELNTLERALCSQEEPSFLISLEEKKKQDARQERRKSKEERKQKGSAAKATKKKDESDDGSIESELTALEIAERLEALALNFEASRNAKQAQTSEQPNPETQSKSSESSSTSSSSFLSEADVEEGSAGDAARGSGSDHSDDVQVQRFTNQLYYEANLDSHDMREDVSIMGPLNAFTPDQIFTDPPTSNVAGASSARAGASDTAAAAIPQASSAQASANDNVNPSSSAAGRAHFAMNKCDSSDSGLHSEVISNSGSMFTISSSDSNQLLGMSDVPAEGSSDQHSPSPPHPPCVQAAACDDNASLSKSDPGTCNNNDGVGIESMDSSNTLVQESESSLDDKKCLNSHSGQRYEEENADTASTTDEDDIMVSPMEEQQKLICSDENMKVVKPHCDTEQTDQALASNVSGLAPSDLRETDGLSQNIDEDVSTLQTSVYDNACGTYNQSVVGGSHVDGALSSNQCEGISEGQGRASNSQSDGIRTAPVDIQDDKRSCSEKMEKASFENSEELSHDSRFCVHQGSEHSQGKCSTHTSACDSCVPRQDKDGNGERCIINKDESCESEALMQLPSSTVDTTESFPTQPAMPLSAPVEDRENNNEVKDSTIESRYVTVSCAEGKDSGNDDPSSTGLEDKRECGQDPTTTVSSLTCSPTTTITAQAAASSSAEATSQASHSSSMNEAIKSLESSENAPPTVLLSETRSHSSITTSQPSLASPSASTAMTNHMDTKGPSSVKGGSKKRKSESKRRQRGDPASSLSQRSTMPNQAKALMDSHLLDSECYHSSETSSYTSECGDQEEIALAIKAAESASRHQVRARFRSSSDMIHRLFVCISGVADQLQTNFAGDLRNILRAVFDMNCSEPIDISDGDKVKDTTPLGAAYRAMSHASRNARRARNSSNLRQEPPSWIPDEQSNECMSCQVPFTFVRRRHHCRNCGKIFCSRCSSNFVPLPHFGQERPVRVCNRCFMFRVTPFTVRPAAT